MTSRRSFLRGSALVGAAAVTRAGAASLPEAPMQSSAATMAPLVPPNGRPYHPVVTLNGWTLPWRMKDNVKEFHLVAEPVVREIAPGMKANLWGYNGQSPGPTIEVVEGDRVRIFVTNKLPEATSIHWHGQILPMRDGRRGRPEHSRPSRPARPTSTSSSARYPGTFMYHPHADETTQIGDGHDGILGHAPEGPVRQHRGRPRLRLCSC